MWVTSLLAGFGAEAVAAFGVASRIESFALIGLMALAAYIEPIWDLVPNFQV